MAGFAMRCSDVLDCFIQEATGMSEADFILLVSLCIIGLGLAAFIGLQLIQAPYGRY